MRTISEFLIENKKRKDISFHMPGHKGRSQLFEKTGYGDWLKDMLGNDITEIPGADALYDPTSTIREVMGNYARLYGANHTELLVNGSSAGVMAAILATVPRGGKLIMGRNSHHSAFSAVRMGGIRPVYMRPEIDGDSNLQSWISPGEVEFAIVTNPDAYAILITSPNYYGMLSDIEEIAAIAHENGMLLIVDQAHGAHLELWDREAILSSDDEVVPMMHAAENLGADIVVNSTHKTLLSYTGTGILNICSDRVNIDDVSEFLRMLQTTSPSYIAMGSLDINQQIMEKWGSEMIRAWKSDLKWFYERAVRIPGLTIAGDPYLPGYGFDIYKEYACMDPTKINLSFAEVGLSGNQFEQELRYRGIVPEMVHGHYVLLMTGAGNIRSDYEALIDALKDISSAYALGGYHTPISPSSGKAFNLSVEAVPQLREMVPLYSADGRVLYSPIVTYPPGSPVACPGEVITMDVIRYIAEAIEAGEKVSGVDDEGRIAVGAEYDQIWQLSDV